MKATLYLQLIDISVLITQIPQIKKKQEKEKLRTEVLLFHLL